MACVDWEKTVWWYLAAEAPITWTINLARVVSGRGLLLGRNAASSELESTEVSSRTELLAPELELSMAEQVIRMPRPDSRRPKIPSSGLCNKRQTFLRYYF